MSVYIATDDMTKMNEYLRVDSYSTYLKYYKVYPEAHSPEYATDNSACFDLKASIRGEVSCNSICLCDQCNTKIFRDTTNSTIRIYPNERALIPTNLIFDIPSGFCIKLYARSGLALNSGMILGNSVGVIDSDYVEPVYVILTNTSGRYYTVADGDRICQGELCKVEKAIFQETVYKPVQKTNRVGGFGSTGLA